MGDLIYREDTLPLLANWFRDKMPASLEALADALGCRYLVFQFGYTMREPSPPPVACEGVVCEILLAMLLHHDPDTILARKVEHTILDGLLHNDRWRRCLEQLSTAHTLVAILASFIEHGIGNLPSKNVRLLHRLVAAKLGPILDEWLGQPPGQEGYTRRLFARALFGEAWCSLVLDRQSPEKSLADIIREVQPRFRAGLIVGQVESEAEELPDLAEA